MKIPVDAHIPEIISQPLDFLSSPPLFPCDKQ